MAGYRLSQPRLSKQESDIWENVSDECLVQSTRNPGAVILRGSRADLEALKILDGMPEMAARQVIEDTQFAIRHKSLH